MPAKLLKKLMLHDMNTVIELALTRQCVKLSATSN